MIETQSKTSVEKRKREDRIKEVLLVGVPSYVTTDGIYVVECCG